MSYNKKIKIAILVGLTGAGKTAAVDYITEKGYPKVYFGGVVLDEIRKAGLEINEENERIFREKLRADEGKDFVVKRIIAQIKDLIAAGQFHIVADGLYTWSEYKIMKHEFPGEIELIAIVAKKRLRHHRLLNRPVRPLTQAEADERDWSEIENLEKGGPIAIADHFLINNGSLEDLHKQIDETLIDIEFTEQ